MRRPRQLAPRSMLLALAFAAPLAASPGLPDSLCELAARGSLDELGRRLRTEAPDRATALAWNARVWSLRGEHDRARQVAEKALAEGAAVALPVLVKARSFLEGGQHAEALGVIRALLAREPGVEAHVLAAEILERTGEYEAARQAHDQAVALFNGLPTPGREERLQAARAGVRNRDPHGALRLLEGLERDYPWMLRVRFETGELFRKHYQTGDAALEYRAGLTIDPGSAVLHASLAQVLWEDGQLDGARRAAREAHRLDPGEPRAWQVLARIALFREDWDAAEEAARKALARRPRHPEYLALMATVHSAAGNQDEAEAAIRECLAVNPRYAELDEALGDIAARQKRHRAAREHYTRGLARRADAPGCLFRRGTLQLRAGRLGAAREDLEKARFLDPFLVPAVNYLKILDRMEGFTHGPIEGGYLALSTDGPSAVRPLFEREVSRLIEDLEGELVHHLGRSHRLEIWGDNRWFNARVQGLPADLLRGVSFGPCLSFSSIELDRPRGGWRRTMRHELVHSFNIDRVGDGYLPRWFTEGLAVHLEGPRPEHWHAIQARAWWAGELLTLAELPEAFMRSDRMHLAYMQAGVALRWILEEVGMEGVNRCLDLFARRVDGFEALRQVMGRDQVALEGAYRAYLERHAGAWPGDPAPGPIPADLRARADAGDGDAARRMAALLLARGDAEIAGIYARRATGPGVEGLRARVMRALRRPGAGEALELAAVAEPDHYGLLVDLAGHRLASREVEAGLAALREAHRAYPGGSEAALALTELLVRKGEEREAEEVLRAFLECSPDNAWAAWRLAELCMKRRSSAEAERYLEQAVQVDATRPELLIALARVRARLARADGARRAYGMFAGVSRVDPGAPGGGPPDVAGSAPDAADPEGDEPVQVGIDTWLKPVPPGARSRSVAWLEEKLRGEEAPALALAGLADSLARESREASGVASRAVRDALRRAMHGAWGREAAHAAAIGMGLSLQEEAAGFLWAARDCPATGPHGQGRCGERARLALEALAARDEKELEPWWHQEGSQGADAWFRESLRRRGYPDPPAGPDGWARLLTIVLLDDAWYRSYGARLRLERILGVHAGRGGFWPGRHRSRVFEPVRSQALATFKRVLKERHLGVH